MKVREIIKEAPLPADWDKKVFSAKVGFDKQLEYALERVRDSGSGTGRMAFVITYRGRPTVLKIARNAKGLLQNASEARPEMYRKYKSVVVPMIDFDTKNKPPRWVHFEKAEPLGDDLDWKVMFGGMHLNNFVQYVEDLVKGRRTKMTPYFEQQYAPYVKFAQQVAKLSQEFDIDTNDLGTIGNWGVYKGRVRLLDLGMDSASAKLYKGS